MSTLRIPSLVFSPDLILISIVILLIYKFTKDIFVTQITGYITKDELLDFSDPIYRINFDNYSYWTFSTNNPKLRPEDEFELVSVSGTGIIVSMKFNVLNRSFCEVTKVKVNKMIE